MKQTKIAIVGAGGQKFVRQTVVDLLRFEELRNVSISLMDINAERLVVAEKLVRLIAKELKASVTIETTTDQRRAVAGADFVLLTFMVGGMKHYASDTFIPEKYGLSIACGDTTGAGAVFRAIRSAPLLADVARNVREMAPSACVLNYANPMAMMLGLLHEQGCPRVLGLCHSWRNALEFIGKWLNIPPDEIDYEIGGLNHVNFLLRAEHKGRSLYPDLLANADRIVKEAESFEAENFRWERTGYERARMELVRYLGYFPLEGPWHQTEYYPWFRKNAAQVKLYGPPTGWAYDFDGKLAERASREADDILSGRITVPVTPGIELGAPIIHSLVTGQDRRVVFNLPNQDNLVPNLPCNAMVEVRGTVGCAGIQPDRVAPLPTQLLGAMLPHHIGHRLAIEGILNRDRSRIRQAVQADPLTSAVLTLPQIDAMVNELFEANREYMADWI